MLCCILGHRQIVLRALKLTKPAERACVGVGLGLRMFCCEPDIMLSH